MCCSYILRKLEEAEMNNLKTLLEQLKIDNPDSRISVMENYMEGILEWNEKVNLTSITDRTEFVQKHFADSLLGCGLSEFANAERIIDVGTGGGFPGVPLAICFPEKKFVLMDSLDKRIRIVTALCEENGIKNVTAIHGRAEELARKKEYRENFDLCISRAVANMSTLSEYCLPFVKEGGAFMAYKGPNCESEINDALRAIGLLGGSLDRIETMSAPGADFRHSLVIVKKTDKTPNTYPRKAGTPAKKPL